MRHNNPFNPVNIADKFFTQWVHKKAQQAGQQMNPDCFVMHYLPHTCIYYFMLSCLAVGISFLVGQYESWFLYFCPFFALGGLYVILYSICYRCYVDEIGITQVNFFFFQKQLRWEDIDEIQVINNDVYRRSGEREIHIRNRQGKKIFAFSYELVGLRNFLKLAKQKELAISYKRTY